MLYCEWGLFALSDLTLNFLPRSCFWLLILDKRWSIQQVADHAASVHIVQLTYCINVKSQQLFNLKLNKKS
jgi:hypothetical protein